MMANFKEILALNEDFQSEILLENEKNFSLINEFSVESDKEEEKLPYRFNVFCQLKTNENAHSALLQQLFSYKKEDDFEALKSFLSFLVEENKEEFKFDCSLIIEPQITAERHRIDVLITEKDKYAIIIENKIHYAVEQENQVERYIEKCKKLGFKNSQIYVLYLTRFGGEPTNFSLNKSREFLQITKRYLPISFDKHIYTWLKDYQQEIDEKEPIFKSAVIQYLDHLEELLQKHNIYIEMNTQLNKFLQEKLKLDEKSALESLNVIDEKINEISKLQHQLQILKDENYIRFFREWQMQLEHDFPNCEIIGNFESEKNYPTVGVLFCYNNHRFSILIERSKGSGKVYFGFGRHFASNELKEEVKEFLKPFIEQYSLEETFWWYGWRYSNYETIYIELNFLIKEIVDKLEEKR